jgi:hypothetical protein
MANTFRMLGIRHCPPPMAAHQFLKYAVKKMKEYHDECGRVDPLVHRLTPIGVKWYHDSGDHRGLEMTNLENMEMTNLENIGTDSCRLHISAERRGRGPNTHVIIITKDKVPCDCCHHDMMDSLCRHIRYGLLSLELARSFMLTIVPSWILNFE